MADNKNTRTTSSNTGEHRGGGSRNPRTNPGTITTVPPKK